MMLVVTLRNLANELLTGKINTVECLLSARLRQS